MVEHENPREDVDMNERANAVTLHGNPLTLLGDLVAAGDKAPDFTVVDNELKEKRLADYAGKVLIVASVPSLDTPVCEMETKRFNKEAASLSNDIVMLTVSMDLPFAQKRWCGAQGVERLVTLSDHREASFGLNWGVLIKELRLLARAVFVVDRKGRVTYVQLVKEVTQEPDYAAAIEAAKAAV
jgi:thiol peroxidase